MSEEREEHRYLAWGWYRARIDAERLDVWAKAHTHLPPWLSLPVSLLALALSVWNALR